MTEYYIGSVADFPEGKGTEVVVDGLRIAVFNLDDELFAVSGICPHKQAPLALAGAEKYASERFSESKTIRGEINEDERTISCPWHGMSFELKTGDCPVARYRLRQFDLAVEGDDVHLTI